MKKAIKTTHEIKAPINNVWEHIRCGAKWENWLPILTDSRVEGNTRYCDLDNGDVLEEQFLASEVEKTFVYTVSKQESFPADNITAIMRLEEVDAENTRLYWSVDMDVETEENFAALSPQIEQIYQASAQKLEGLATVAA